MGPGCHLLCCTVIARWGLSVSSLRGAGPELLAAALQLPKSSNSLKFEAQLSTPRNFSAGNGDGGSSAWIGAGWAAV